MLLKWFVFITANESIVIIVTNEIKLSTLIIIYIDSMDRKKPNQPNNNNKHLKTLFQGISHWHD